MAKKKKKKSGDSKKNSIFATVFLSAFRLMSIRTRLIVVTSMCVLGMIIGSAAVSFYIYKQDKKAYIMEQCLSFAGEALNNYRFTVQEYIAKFNSSPDKFKYIKFKRDAKSKEIKKVKGNLDYDERWLGLKKLGVNRYPKSTEIFMVTLEDKLHLLYAEKKEIKKKKKRRKRRRRKSRRRRKKAPVVQEKASAKYETIYTLLENGANLKVKMDNSGRRLMWVMNSAGDLITTNNAALMQAGPDISGRGIVLQAVMGERNSGSGEYSDDGYDVIAVYREVPKSNTTVYVEIPLATAMKSVTKVLITSGLFNLVLLVIVILIIGVFIGLIVKPLVKVAKFTEEVAAGNYDVSIDYYFKDELNLLITSFRNMVDSLLKREEELSAITEIANKDHLTKIFNNRYFKINSAEGLKKTAEEGVTSSFIILDVDKFKVFNDTYGHLQGDKVLIDVAAALASCGGEKDLVARYGGEEFVAYSHNVDPEYAMALAEKLRITVAKTQVDYLDKPGEFLSVKISLGVAMTNGKNFTDIKEAIKAADEALYYCKEHGRNMSTLWTPNGCKGIEKVEDV